jgi:hypothetical protein
MELDWNTCFKTTNKASYKLSYGSDLSLKVLLLSLKQTGVWREILFHFAG